MSFGKAARFEVKVEKPRVVSRASLIYRMRKLEKETQELEAKVKKVEELELLAELELHKEMNRLLKEFQVRCRSCGKDRLQVDQWMMVRPCGHLYCQTCAAQTGNIQRNCGRGECNVSATTEPMKVFLPEIK